jgi:hypothetical protein
VITELKFQVEEDRRIEETLISQLEEKEKMIENLEAKIVTLRKDIKKDMQHKNTKTLDEIINNQRPYYDMSRLVYN